MCAGFAVVRKRAWHSARSTPASIRSVIAASALLQQRQNPVTAGGRSWPLGQLKCLALLRHDDLPAESRMDLPGQLICLLFVAVREEDAARRRLEIADPLQQAPSIGMR